MQPMNKWGSWSLSLVAGNREGANGMICTPCLWRFVMPGQCVQCRTLRWSRFARPYGTTHGFVIMRPASQLIKQFNKQYLYTWDFPTNFLFYFTKVHIWTSSYWSLLAMFPTRRRLPLQLILFLSVSWWRLALLAQVRPVSWSKMPLLAPSYYALLLLAGTV